MYVDIGKTFGSIERATGFQSC